MNIKTQTILEIVVCGIPGYIVIIVLNNLLPEADGYTSNCLPGQDLWTTMTFIDVLPHVVFILAIAISLSWCRVYLKGGKM